MYQWIILNKNTGKYFIGETLFETKDEVEEVINNFSEYKVIKKAKGTEQVIEV